MMADVRFSRLDVIDVYNVPILQTILSLLHVKLLPLSVFQMLVRPWKTYNFLFRSAIAIY